MTIAISGGTMAFLKLPTKIVLVQVDMLNQGFYTKEELAEISGYLDFHSWSPRGYYSRREVGNAKKIEEEE